MKKRMRIMLFSVGILFGSIFLWKGFSKIMLNRYLASHQNPIVTVSTTTAKAKTWQNKLTAVGTIRAINGVNVTTQAAGMVQAIYFKPGDTVQAGATLVQLNANSDNALLQALRANAELGKITYERDKKQFAVHAISKQTLDSDYQNMQNLIALAEQQAAIVRNKTITAPFSGRLGISAVNLGQWINPGDKVVTLQALDPIYVDFALPQQTLSQLRLGLPVTITSDAFPNEMFSGTITTVDPLIDLNTRNIAVEATIANPQQFLLPGMFTMVTVNVGKKANVLTLPQTAITFNPYGEIVFLIQDKKGEHNGKPIYTVKQIFVKTGATRGDQIQILAGVEPNQQVVASGQLKLKNGSQIQINNTVTIPDEANPNLANDHQG